MLADVVVAQEEALGDDGWAFTISQIRLVTYILRLMTQLWQQQDAPGDGEARVPPAGST